MATQWAAYSEDMRLGQGFNSYVQETRVNDAVLITKTLKKKTSDKLIVSSRQPSLDSGSRGTTIKGSENSADSETRSSDESTRRDLKSLRDISRSDAVGVATQLRKNGLLDHDTSAALLSLVGSISTPKKNVHEEKSTPTRVPAAAKTDRKDEDERAGVCGLPAWPKMKKESKPKRSVPTKELELPMSARPFPCNLAPAEDARNQRVTFTSKEVTDQKDIQKILGISASASVKSGNIGGDAGGSYDCEAEIAAADMTFVVHVRVTNESPDYEETMEFNHIESLTKKLTLAVSNDKEAPKPAVEFTKIYGDCFISDFTTGGELFAIIHITTHNKQNKNAIRLHATAQLSPPASPVNVGAEMNSSSESSSAFDDSEISINLVWRGGGEVKVPDVNWDIPTLMRVANAFPTLVSRSHAKIGAILMPYTSLRSYQEWRMKAGLGNLRLDYSHCGPFADVLYSEYCEYGAIAAELDAIMSAPGDYRSGHRGKKGDPGVTAGKETAKQLERDNDPEAVPQLSPCTPVEVRRQATWGAVDDLDGEDQITATFDPSSSDPLPLSPESLRAARLFCVQAMSMIQQRVQAIAVDPSAPEEFVNYPCPARFRKRLPHHKYSDTGVAFVYDDRDPMIPAEIAVSRSLFYADKMGDEVGKHRKCEHFAIGNLTIKQPRRDLYEIKIHPYTHRGWLSRSKITKSYHNAIAGITFVYCNLLDPEKTSATAMRFPTKIHTVGKGNPGKLPNRAEENNAKLMSGKRMQEKFDEIKPERLSPLDIQQVTVFWEPGSGYIAGIAFYDGTGVQRSEISHYQWGSSKDPVPETMQSKSYYFEGQQPFAGLVGSFECVSGWAVNKVLARCALVYGVPDGSK